MARLPSIERAILRSRSPGEKVAWTAASVILPTVLRWLIDKGASGVPFVTYFPAVVLAALFLGWRWASITALLSAITANRLFRPDLPVTEFGWADFIMAGLFAFSCSILIYSGHLIRQLLQVEQEAREREIVLNRELKHRVKNMLSVIQAIATTTFRRTGPDGFLNAFSSRVAALARATDLSMHTGDPQQISDIVTTAIGPFQNKNNFHVSGPPMIVDAPLCVPLIMAIHELCTNAVKHGSLSVAGGVIELSWHYNGPKAILHWREVGGPRVEPPVRAGMGSLLLRPAFGLQTDLQFNPEGLECIIGFDIAGKQQGLQDWDCGRAST